MIEKNKLIRYFIVGVLFFLIMYVLSILSARREKKYNFRGVIEKIQYSEKKIPTVTVKGKQYGMTTGWRFNEKMRVGDSLIKELDSTSYKLVKFGTGEVISSNE